jgi:hypothetical protein
VNILKKVDVPVFQTGFSNRNGWRKFDYLFPR